VTDGARGLDEQVNQRMLVIWVHVKTLICVMIPCWLQFLSWTSLLGLWDCLGESIGFRDLPHASGAHKYARLSPGYADLCETELPVGRDRAYRMPIVVLIDILTPARTAPASRCRS
jgi:hypothetical protein